MRGDSYKEVAPVPSLSLGEIAMLQRVQDGAFASGDVSRSELLADLLQNGYITDVVGRLVLTSLGEAAIRGDGAWS